MRHASLTLCQCIWKSIWLRVELHCDIYFVHRSFPLPSFLSFSLSLSRHTVSSLHVLLFEQLPVHKVNLSLLRNSTLIFEIDKHFCVLQLGVAGGQGAGSKGFTVKSCALPVAFFSASAALAPPRFPISSRNHLFLLLYCKGSGSVMDRREAGGQEDSLFLLCDLLLLCHRRRRRRRRVLC